MLQRIKQYIDFKNINVSNFERSIGMSNASFGKSLKNRGTIGCDKLEIILNVYPDINLEWLITGKGEMLKKEGEEGQKETPKGFSELQDKYVQVVEENSFLKSKIIDMLEGKKD